MTEITVTTFYKFIDIKDPEALKFELARFCKDNAILGTILIAHEGINANMSGTADSIELFKQFILNMDIFSDVEFKDSYLEYWPFHKLKIKIKDEIIKIATDIDIKNTGKYINANEWDKLLEDKNTIVIDTRNKHECGIGTFDNAINPQIERFSDLPSWINENLKEEDKEKNVLMFCTGGIRCEKSTAYLKAKGFKKVYHLKGGVLKYFADTKNRTNKWNGFCFVFDDRIAVDKNLKPVINKTNT